MKALRTIYTLAGLNDDTCAERAITLEKAPIQDWKPILMSKNGAAPINCNQAWKYLAHATYVICDGNSAKHQESWKQINDDLAQRYIKSNGIIATYVGFENDDQVVKFLAECWVNNNESIINGYLGITSQEFEYDGHLYTLEVSAVQSSISQVDGFLLIGETKAGVSGNNKHLFNVDSDILPTVELAKAFLKVYLDARGDGIKIGRQQTQTDIIDIINKL